MRAWLVIGAVNGFLAVAMGAYAAHGLAGDAYAAGLADKASRYQMVHALAVLAAAWVGRNGAPRLAQGAAALFTAGIVLFCGTLYAMALFHWPVAAVAPFGGFSLLGGWVLLAAAGWRTKPV